MSWTLYGVTASLPASQLSRHRPCWFSPYVSSPTAAAAKHTGLYTIRPQGKARHQHLGVRCCSCQHQDAREQQKGPNVSRLSHTLQQQWDHAANAHLGPIDIKPHSNKKVWWTCDQCPDGHRHTWEATVTHRTSGTGCPQCAGRKVCKHNCLATKAPNVAAQWDYEANDSTPDDVVAQSSQRVGWRCDTFGHKWSATPNHRVSKKKAGCPKCARIARTKMCVKHPTFAEGQHPHNKAVLAEWDHERNAQQGNFPNNTTLRSAKPIFWLCTQCPAGLEHSWSAKPLHRSYHKSDCPLCAGRIACRCNSLQELYPDLAAEWDYAKNEGRPEDYTAGSTVVAWWFSSQRGSWQQSIHSRTTGPQQRSARLKRMQQEYASQT